MSAYLYSLHTVIMMRNLIQQVWREQNNEITVHLFDNASDNSRQQVGKNIKWQIDKTNPY